MWVGISSTEDNQFDLYFFPSLLIEEIKQDSISINKIEDFKNKYEILEKCKDKDFILEKAREYKIIS